MDALAIRFGSSGCLSNYRIGDSCFDSGKNSNS